MDEFNNLLRQARDALASENYETSRDKYLAAQKCVTEPRYQAIIRAELSWVYYYLQDYQKATEAGERVLDDDPEYKAREDVARLLGYAYLGLKNLTLAEKYLHQSLEYDSLSDKQQHVKYELGKIYFVQGNYDLAYPYFKEISAHFKQANPDYFLSTLFYLGFIHYYLKNYKMARENFQEILAEQPAAERQSSAYYGLAFLEFNDKNYLNVISLCEKIVSVDRNFFDRETVGFLTTASYYYLGRYDIFSEYYKQMNKAYPEGRYRSELVRMSQTTPLQNPPPSESKN